MELIISKSIKKLQKIEEFLTMSQIQSPRIKRVLSEVRSNKNILPPVEEIEAQLAQKSTQMSQCQKSKKYNEAYECKENVERLKKDLLEKKLYDLVLKHKREKRTVEGDQEEDFNQFNATWAKKIAQCHAEGQRLKDQMESRHQSQIQNAKTELESQISNKIKESAQCLNLRKIEEQMAKQQKYAEAHYTQQTVFQLEKKELEMFQKQRAAKIQGSLAFLMSKQKTQQEALQQKIESHEIELEKQKESEAERIKLKNQNTIKQLKSQQEKQILTLKGQLKNRVSVTSVKSKSKLTPFSTTH